MSKKKQSKTNSDRNHLQYDRCRIKRLEKASAETVDTEFASREEQLPYLVAEVNFLLRRSKREHEPGCYLGYYQTD